MKNQEIRMHQARILAGQGMKQYRIAEILGVTDRTIRNYLTGRSPTLESRKLRPSKLDPFKSYIRNILEDDPLFNCEVLLRQLQAMGYTGKISILRDLVLEYRQEIQKEVVLRFETQAGYQIQMDWKELPRDQWKGIYAFVMVLGYSRTPFVHFTRDMTSGTLLICHQLGFEYFNGVSETVLYDNMKTAWIYKENQWHPNSRLLEMASEYGFTPKRCAVRRPQTKGKVERFIGYLTTDFLSEARLRGLQTVDQLNDNIGSWLKMVGEKKLRDFSESRDERFKKDQKYLQPLPVPSSFDPRDCYDLIVNREGMINFKTNRYSVPPEYIGKTLVLRVNPLEQTGEVFYQGKSIRIFELMKAGTHQRIFIGNDESVIYSLWESQRSKKAVKVKRKIPHITSNIPVEIRPPSYYDNLVADGGSL